MKIINENIVIEVIGRLKGRGICHQNSAKQTTDEKKKKAHLSAAEDLLSLSMLLSEAFDNPEEASSNKAYNKAVNHG